MRMAKRLLEDHHRWWPSFLVGAAAGLAAGALLRGRLEPSGEEVGVEGSSRDGWARLRGAWGDAVEGAAEGLTSARQMLAPEPTIDVAELQGILDGTPGSAGCRLRLLSEGIVEVVGSCASEEELDAILDALAAVPGVDVVVNRVWMPDSSGSTEAAGTPPAH